MGDVGTGIGGEAMLSFYDIFVRNSFGSYRTILKEVSYHYAMSRWLTYHESKSTGFNFQQDSRHVLRPDEVCSTERERGFAYWWVTCLTLSIR